MVGCKNLAMGWCRLLVEQLLLGPDILPDTRIMRIPQVRRERFHGAVFDTLSGLQQPADIFLCLLSAVPWHAA